jgi:hypothetical protein
VSGAKLIANSKWFSIDLNLNLEARVYFMFSIKMSK